ncbi:MAG: hypothetical protein H6658_02115 [Ardenticatenaceae bacterium]|nr:hypothetical protein [Ardenticatenaceae bacterium]
MTDLVIDSTKVKAVEAIEQFTGPTDEAIVPGVYCRLNTTTGKITKGNASSAAEARKLGVCISNLAGRVTVLRKGIVFLDDALDALTYDDDVFLSNTDGTLADAAGTVSLIVGTVVPLYGYLPNAKKGLRLDL